LAKALSRRGGCAGGPVGSAIDPRGVTAEPPAVVPQPSTAAAAIEIDLAGKYRVRVGIGVEAEALRRVLDVLERR
jgi:transposase